MYIVSIPDYSFCAHKERNVVSRLCCMASGPRLSGTPRTSAKSQLLNVSKSSMYLQVLLNLAATEIQPRSEIFAQIYRNCDQWSMHKKEPQKPPEHILEL